MRNWHYNCICLFCKSGASGVLGNDDNPSELEYSQHQRAVLEGSEDYRAVFGYCDRVFKMG